MVDTNDILHAFGPLAFIMDIPEANSSIEHTQAHHKHGRIGMGYNIATIFIESSEVQLNDYEVKVKMKQVEIIMADGE
jgi:hypothetical protein